MGTLKKTSMVCHPLKVPKMHTFALEPFSHVYLTDFDISSIYQNYSLGHLGKLSGSPRKS